MTDVYDMRLRTTATDDNGEGSLTTSPGTAVVTPTHIVYTRDVTGTRRIYIDGVEGVNGAIGGNFANWDGSYRLALANELTEDRPWLGDVYLVAVYDRALSAAEVNHNYGAGMDITVPVAGFTAAPVNGAAPLTVTFSNSSTGATTDEWDFGDGITSTATSPVHVYAQNGSYTVTLAATHPHGSDTLIRPGYVTVADAIPRVTGNLQALYTFQEGSGTTVQDVSGVGTPLDLTIADPGNVSWLPGGGLAITSSALISSTAPATKIISASMATDEMTMEAWVKPANTTQDGPARIVTLSADTVGRNFTLGQGGGTPPDRFDVRLRTTATDLVGRPSLLTPSGTATTTLTHIVYTRDVTGTRTIYIDTAVSVSGTIGGDFSNWNATYPLGLANELTRDRPWLGELHLVAVYDRALSAADVQQNFAAGPHPDSGPVADFSATP